MTGGNTWHYNSGGVNTNAYLKGLSGHSQIHHTPLSTSAGYLLSLPNGNGEVVLNITYKADTLPSGAALYLGLDGCLVYIHSDYAYVILFSGFSFEFLTPVFNSWVNLKITVNSAATSVAVQHGSETVILPAGSWSSIGTVSPIIGFDHQGLNQNYNYYLDHHVFLSRTEKIDLNLALAKGRH